jgi:hypothetical protein
VLLGYVIGLVSFLLWVVIELMTILNPSATIPINAPLPAVISVYILSAIAAFVLPVVNVLPSNTLRGWRFFRRFTTTFVLLVLVAWYCGITVHRDFLTFTTPAVLIFFTILLYRVDELGIVTRKTVVLPRLARASTLIFMLWIGWIMMMSYAIVTRVEPRWIESIAYNLGNGILGLVMLYVGATLYDRAKRTVHYRSGGWHLDERNVSLLVSPQEQQILHILFTEPERSITCGNLVGLLRGAAGTGNEALEQCERCLTEQWTASQCSTYRNLKNRVADIKKYLELLQIGSLVPVSENPRHIKESGWRLRVFDDVRIVPAATAMRQDITRAAF